MTQPLGLLSGGSLLLLGGGPLDLLYSPPDSTSLTAQQLVDVRYFMGYSVTGSSTPYLGSAAAPSTFRELAYSDTDYMGLSLDYRLATLSAEEISRVTGYFLLNLYLREAEIQTAAANLDTDKAAAWTHNRDEVAHRTSLFTALRRDLCRFMGFAGGSALTRRNQLVRA